MTRKAASSGSSGGSMMPLTLRVLPCVLSAWSFAPVCLGLSISLYAWVLISLHRYNVWWVLCKFRMPLQWSRWWFSHGDKRQSCPGWDANRDQSRSLRKAFSIGHARKQPSTLSLPLWAPLLVIWVQSERHGEFEKGKLCCVSKAVCLVSGEVAWQIESESCRRKSCRWTQKLYIYCSDECPLCNGGIKFVVDGGITIN